MPPLPAVDWAQVADLRGTRKAKSKAVVALGAMGETGRAGQRSGWVRVCACEQCEGVMCVCVCDGKGPELRGRKSPDEDTSEVDFE
eukprot:2955099-Pleurochrysis_carterae.AAC.1